jgi:hypothetical protein
MTVAQQQTIESDTPLEPEEAMKQRESQRA